MIRNFVTLSRTIHVISAVWVLILGFAIIADVLGRAVFSAPIQGTTEIIKASVVSIAFLQLPLAIFSGSMLRTEIFANSMGPTPRRIARTANYLAGAALFFLIAYASWDAAIFSVVRGEYEGEGALRLPTWPVRWTIVVTAALTGLAYLTMIWLDWKRRLEMELAYPGVLQYDAEQAATISSDKGDR
jgi:TRAP-type C4-dicarboxylate transport system permease small subunit